MISHGVDGKLFPVGDVPALAEAIEAAWKDRDALGSAAVELITKRFNLRMLYNQLAESVRHAAGVSVDHSEWPL